MNKGDILYWMTNLSRPEVVKVEVIDRFRKTNMIRVMPLEHYRGAPVNLMEVRPSESKLFPTRQAAWQGVLEYEQEQMRREMKVRQKRIDEVRAKIEGFGGLL